MKYRLLQLLIIFCSLLAANSLLAQSTDDPTNGCAPVSITFKAPENATSFFWDFKDGATSTSENPTNTFINPGTYEVTFSNTQGGATVGTITVKVYAKPTLEITQDPDPGCAPATVQLTNSTNIPDGISLLSTTWTFPDGDGGNNIFIEKDFAIPGQYGVTMGITTSSANCNSVQVFDDFITVVEGLSPTFSVSPSNTACSGPFEVTFGNDTPGSDLNYLWDFGNGNLSSEENPPNQTYENGDYDVTLRVENENGCIKSISQRISVGPPNASFVISDTVCVGSPVTIQNTSSAGTYAWSITGPENTVTAETNPEVTFPIEGIYQIRLDVTGGNGACTNNVTKTVFAQNLDPTFTADPTYDCEEPMAVTFTLNNPLEGAIYNWDFGDDSTSTEVNPVHDYNADNESPYHPNGEFKYTAKLSASTTAGCMAEFETEVVLDIPKARFMPDTVSGCAPLTVEFSDSSHSTQPIINWEWIYDDGNTNNFGSGDAHNYTFNDPGEYDVQLVIRNNLNCPDTSYVIRVEVGERIIPDFTIDKTSVCQGEVIQFTDNSNNTNIDEWHYYTDNDRASHCFSEANPIIPFDTETGNFEVQMVVGYNGCLDSITKSDFIEVKGPIAEIDFRMSCDTPNTVQFISNSGDATDVSWDFGDMSTGTEATVAHDYANTGDFMVTLTATNPSTGCAPSMATQRIQIRNIKADGPVEMKQCKDQPIMLNSESSTDVDTSCFRGYTWFFNHPGVRPVTTSKTTVDDQSYPDTGMYVLDLVVEDVNGCTDTARYPIIVHEAKVSFDIDKTEICSPQSIQISNVQSSTTSENIESFMWDFGDMVGMSEEENPGSYTYSLDPGSDQITITVMVEDDAGCPGNAERTLDFYRPTSQIRAGDLTICAGEMVEVTATPFIRNGVDRPLEYNWDFGNMETADKVAAQTTYNEGGIYTIRLEYTEIATGCTGVASATANVQDFPEAAFTTDVDDKTRLCAPTQINLMDASTSLVPLSQSWDFGNGGSGVGATTAAAFAPGTYTVTLLVQTSNGCDDDVEREFIFEQGPTGTLMLSGTEFCVGDEVTVTLVDTMNVTGFSWEFEGSSFGEGETSVTFPITMVPPSGQAPIKINLNGFEEDCDVSDSENITVREVSADFEAETPDCILDVSFANNSSENVLSAWDFGDGNTSSATSPDYTYASPGVYNVSLTVTDQATECTDNITKEVIVGAMENEGMLMISSINCLDVNFGTDLSGLDAISIDYGDGESGSILSHTYASGGDYIVTLTGQNGDCLVGPLSLALNLVGEQDYSNNFDVQKVDGTCLQYQIVNLDSETINNVSLGVDWGGPGRSTGPFGFEYDQEGTYNVLLAGGTSCGTFEERTENVTASIDDAAPGAEEPRFVPNAFTPGDDGFNDVFQVQRFPLNRDADQCRTIDKVFTYRIYNRWGKQIFSVDDNFTFPPAGEIMPGEILDHGWEPGTGRYPPAGVYLYVIEVEFDTGSREVLKGNVTLIR